MTKQKPIPIESGPMTLQQVLEEFQSKYVELDGDLLGPREEQIPGDYGQTCYEKDEGYQIIIDSITQAYLSGAKAHEEAVRVEKNLHSHNSIPSYTADLEEGCIICINNKLVDEQSNKSKQFIKELEKCQ